MPQEELIIVLVGALVTDPNNACPELVFQCASNYARVPVSILHEIDGGSFE